MRNRIKEHRKVRAGDLVPHELNPRVHSEAQREALRALYEEIGFARSVLAYELPDGRLKLIDGHLRQSMDPDMEVEVEVLDVTDEEARKLLLSIDPLAALADFDDAALEELRSITETDNQTLNELWANLASKDAEAEETINKVKGKANDPNPIPEQFIVLIECSTEKDQIALLRRLKREGLNCKAITN